jgi:hypothetical protein
MAGPCGFIDKVTGKEYETLEAMLADIAKGNFDSSKSVKALKVKNKIESLKEEVRDLKGQVRDVFNASVEALKSADKSYGDKAKTIKDAVNNSIKIFKDSLGKKEISNSQYKSILSKLGRISSEKDTSKAIEDFVNHVDNVFDTADYKQKVENSNKARKKAISRLSKAGVVKDTYSVESLKRMLSLNPDRIPSESISKYEEIVNKLADGKLSGEGANALVQDANNVIASYENKNVKDVDLKQRLDDFINDFEDLEGKSYEEVVTDMLKSENITSAESKYLLENQEFFEDSAKTNNRKPKEPYTKEEKDEKKATIKGSLNDIQDLKDVGVLDKSTKSRIDNILDNVSDEYLDSLSDKELDNIKDHLLNIGDGFINKHLNTIDASIELFNSAKSVKEALGGANVKLKDLAASSRVKAVFNRLIKSKNTLKRSGLSNQISRYHKYAVDTVLGLKNTDLAGTFFGKGSQQVGAHDIYTLDTRQKLINPIEKYLQDIHGSDTDAIFRAKVRAKLYVLQRLHETSGSSKDLSVDKYFSDKFFNDKGENNKYSKETRDVIREEVEKFRSLDFNSEEYFKSKDFGDSEKELVKAHDKFYNSDIKNKAYDTSFYDDGNVLQVKENYTPVSFSSTSSKAESLEKEINDKVLEFTKPSFKAGNILEKTGSTGGENRVISLDITEEMHKYLDDVSSRYHLLDRTRRDQALMKALLKDPSLTEDQKIVIQTIESLQHKSIAAIHSKGMGLGFLGFFSGKVTKVKLVGITKAGPELIGNIINSLPNTTKYIDGVSIYKSILKSGAENNKILYALKVPQAARFSNNIFELPKIGGQGGADVPFETRIKNSSNLDSAGKKLMLKLYRNSQLEGTQKTIEQLGDFMLATPDKAVAVPLFYGLFEVKFKELTGEKPDYKKISDGDVEYLDKFRKQLDKATRQADVEISQVVSSKNPYVVAGKYQTKSSAGQSAVILNHFNSNLRAHNSGQATGIYMALDNMISNGKITRKDAAILGSKFASQFAYTASKRWMTASLFSGVASALGLSIFNDDEKKEGQFKRDLIGSAISLATGASGNFASNAASVGAEFLNDKYMQGVTYEGRYNKNFSSFGFTSYDPNGGVFKNAFDYLISNTGSLGIASEEVRKDVEAGEGDVKSGIVKTLLGTGILPFAKDVNAMQSQEKFSSIPSIKDQKEIYKSNDQNKIKELELKLNNYAKVTFKNKIIGVLKEKGGKEFERLFADPKYNDKVINELKIKIAKNIHIPLTGDIDGYVKSAIKDVTFDYLVRTNKIDKNIQKMYQMKSEDLNTDLVKRARDAKNNPEELKKVQKDLNILFKLGKVDSSVITKYETQEIKSQDK